MKHPDIFCCYFCLMLRSLTLVSLFLIVLLSCERTLDNTAVKLVFSSDTIHFDTVFASIGSTTRELRVKNKSRATVIVNRISLGGANDSDFRLNIDGESTSEMRDVKIEAGDSLFIFVDVFVSPDNTDSPFIVADSIIFETEGNVQKVYLLAWGQDIILVNNMTIGSESWTGNKPYILYGKCMVDTLATLVIEEGVRVYFHRQASLVVAGSLTVNGSLDSPVIMASDRLESAYSDIPGQWDGIMFLNTSRGNRISYSEISNSIVGIRIGEPYDVATFPNLKVLNTRIYHSSVSGISAISANIQVANSIIAHSGSYCINLQAGGDYSFIHCTVENWWEYGFRLTPSLSVQEDSGYPLLSCTQLNLNIGNCVISGNLNSEVDIDPSSSQYSGNYYFDHCLLKIDTVTSSFWTQDRFHSTILNMDPLFLGDINLDFRPDTLSPLIDSGNEIYTVDYPSDIRGASRETGGKPDIGAFERIPGEKNK
jgi:hypothetical protein